MGGIIHPPPSPAAKGLTPSQPHPGMGSRCGRRRSWKSLLQTWGPQLRSPSPRPPASTGGWSRCPHWARAGGAAGSGPAVGPPSGDAGRGCGGPGRDHVLGAFEGARWLPGALDGLSPAALRLFGWVQRGWGGESAGALGVMPGKGPIRGELGKSGSALPAASSCRGSGQRGHKAHGAGWQGAGWQGAGLGARGGAPRGASTEHHHAPAAGAESSGEAPGGESKAVGGHPGTSTLPTKHPSQPGACWFPPRPGPEHPTVPKREAGALQRRSEQRFGNSSASLRRFGATKAPQISNPIANRFI